MYPVVFNRRLELWDNANLTCVSMTQSFIDSISYNGPNPCAVSSAPSCCIDLKNVAACVS
jgi:hypothetical protein